jgi:hypothetical protein
MVVFASTDILSETVISCLQPTEQLRCINLMDGLTVRGFGSFFAESVGQELKPMSH